MGRKPRRKKYPGAQRPTRRVRRKDFIELLVNEHNIRRRDAAVTYDALINEIAERIAMGEEVILDGIGRFTTVTFATTVNPLGEVKDKPYRFVEFYVSPRLHDRARDTARRIAAERKKRDGS